jgi:hypothetical protein
MLFSPMIRYTDESELERICVLVTFHFMALVVAFSSLDSSFLCTNRPGFRGVAIISWHLFGTILVK